jgi:hypothetical protein
MKTAIRWIAGFFEDQGNSASSKRIIVYVCLYYLYLMVQGMLSGKVIDQTVLFVVAGIVLFGIGAITSEFFTMFGSTKKTENKPE